MTSEVLQASLSRRSCKKYKADPVPARSTVRKKFLKMKRGKKYWPIWELPENTKESVI